MSTIRVGENESVESAIKRFKRKCKKAEAARKRNKN